MSEQPWTKSYPNGVRWDAAIETGPVQSILEQAALNWPSGVALDFMGARMTYAELNRLSDQVAAGLQSLGVGPGVHVGIYLPNTPHYFTTFFGILKAGGTVVNYSPLDAEAVLEHKVEDSETSLLVTLDVKALFPQMQRLLGHTRLKGLVVGSIADFAPHPEAVTAAQHAAGELADVRYGGPITRFADLLHAESQPVRHPVADPNQAIAVLQYTGGTTGLPKGAILTHANLTAATHQIWLTAMVEPPVMRMGQERLLAVLPPFHVYALVVNMLFGIKLGAEIILHARFDMAAVLNDIVAKRVTVFCGVPTMFVGMLGANLQAMDLTSLRFCNSGGAPLPVQVQDQFQAFSGASLNEGWGMTETSAIGSFTPAFGVRHAGSCGIPAPGVEFRFTDITDPTRVLARGERGEIGVRGPNIMRGYWKNDRATAEMISPDRFMRTGDVGYMDEDGYVYIVDRTKDMLLCGGFNVYPRVIEEAIYQHPAVAEVAVIGIADTYRGQAPKAFIRQKPDTAELSLDELKSFLKPLLGKHEMISAVAIVEALPRTPVGKIDKKPLYAAEETGKKAVLF
jgi:long-chain acyl-CoA synthetase